MVPGGGGGGGGHRSVLGWETALGIPGDVTFIFDDAGMKSLKVSKLL